MLFVLDVAFYQMTELAQGRRNVENTAKREKKESFWRKKARQKTTLFFAVGE